MFASGLERFDGDELLQLDAPAVVCVVQGYLEVTRHFAQLGVSWSVKMPGPYFLLPAGNYRAKGSALLWVRGDRPTPPAAR